MRRMVAGGAWLCMLTVVSLAPGSALRAESRSPLIAAPEPVVELLPVLRELDGSELKAAQELGERAVFVYARGLTPAQARRAVADVVGGIWVKADQGAALRLEPDAAVAREAVGIVQARKRRFFAGLRSLVRNLSLDEKGLERLRATDPAAAAYLQEPANRAAVQLSGLLPERVWRALEEGGQVTLSREQLGTEGEAAVRRYVGLMNEARSKVPMALPPGAPPTPSLDVERALEAGLTLRVMPGLQAAPFGYLTVGLGDGAVSQFMTISGSRAQDEPSPRWVDAQNSAGDRLPAPEPEIELRSVPKTWAEAVRLLGSEGGLSVVSEEITPSFMGNTSFPRPLKGPVPEILDEVCRNFNYQWRYRGGVYEFRQSQWYVERAVEPPATLVKRARLAQREKRPLDLDWLAAAAAVEPNRAPKLWTYAPSAAPAAIRFQTLLQFYGALDPEQRRQLSSDAGLVANRLSLARQREFATVLRQHASRLAGDAGSTSLQLALEKDAARWTFTAGSARAQVVVPLASAGASPFGPSPFGSSGLGGGGFAFPPPPGGKPEK